MNTADLAFPKPGDMKTTPKWIEVMPDGREILNKGTLAGRKEYRDRTMRMVERQHSRCCLEGHIPECPGYLKHRDATFEHEDGRSGGRQDDRIELPDGRWINGAAHWICNQLKGSRRIPYNDAHNAEISAAKG